MSAGAHAESIFDKPGGLAAVTEFNESRKAMASADDAYDEACRCRWLALVRMAKAHKSMCQVAGSDEAAFCHWLESLYGDRDEILKQAINARQGDGL